MSTKDYLKSLDRGQLVFARDTAQKMIEEIEAEEKITLWIVSDRLMNIACFEEKDFDKAKKVVCEAIMSDEFKPMDVACRSHPEIRKEIAFESEVADWMSLNG